MADIINKILGKVLGSIVLAFYFILSFLLLALYIRYFIERVTSTIYPLTSMHFFAVTMLVLVFYTLRGGLVHLARYNEILFAIFVIAFGIILFLSFQYFKINRLLPVTPRDIIPAAVGSKGILGIWGYFFLIFFIADKVKDKDKLLKQGLRTSVFLWIIGTLIIVNSVGILGTELLLHVPLPFIFIAKIISVLGALERFESLVLAIWVIVDFVIISVFCYLCVNILKSIFKLKDEKPFISPVLLAAYTMTFFIALNRAEITALSNKFMINTNVIMTFVVPPILLVIGKIRKVI